VRGRWTELRSRVHISVSYNLPPLPSSSRNSTLEVDRIRLVLPVAIQGWSLTSLQQRLFRTGGRLTRHARYFVLQLAESHLTGSLFWQILARIERLAWHPT
jgi:hypothetical protein